MKLKEWLSELKYEMMQGSLEEEVEEVVYDSRKAAEHSVFICMKGANADSHQFVPDVLKKGTRVFVVEEDIDVPADITVLKVENGRNALSLLSAARFDYPVRKMVSIGVTGTKGKTTSTYMIKSILEAAGEQVGLIGTNGAVIGANHYPTKNTTPESYILQEYFARMVEEGCTYMVMEVSSQSYLMHRVDGIFFDYSIFLNISNDHIGPNEHATFEEYLYYKKQLLQNSGIVLVNRDDEHFESIIEGSAATVKTFALDHAADFMAENLQYIREHDFVGLDFQVTGDYDIKLRVNVPGRFNVYNALAAIAVSVENGIDGETIKRGLLNFTGTKRRFEKKGDLKGITVIDDYAHHPQEIEATLKAARNYPHKRIWCVFQPHTYTRTKALLPQFAEALSLADCVVLADIYPARETDTLGVSSGDIAALLEEKGVNTWYLSTFDEIETFILENCIQGDLLITMGAGDVVKVGEELLGL
ncbi:MAG: UDP-N-acetylmuramyl-tripeptide synthetase [Clostridium sp.]